MPVYHQIPQVAITAAIKDAHALLELHPTGAELQAHLAKLNPAALDAIDAAQSDAELAKAINDSGIEASFVHLARLLRFHGEADTDGKGLEIYRKLAKWGAFDGARAISHTALDCEIDAFINSQPESIRAKAAFNAATVATRIAEVSPFKSYVIEIDGLKDGAISIGDYALQVMCHELERIYEDTNELRSTTVGSISPDADARCGIVLVTTEALAMRLAYEHQSLNIFNADGVQLLPVAPAQRQTSSPTP